VTVVHCAMQQTVTLEVTVGDGKRVNCHPPVTSTVTDEV
jgi:hypothetical protein